LGELEVRQNQYSKARAIFAKGISLDSHCTSLYNAAALLEGKLGNLDLNFN
jgi:uncharacterized protein HemY